MKPYYDHAGITIYHGDCLPVIDGIADGSVGAVITDPPFSSGARTDAGRAMRGSMVRGQRWESDWFSHDNMATHGFMFLMRLLGRELFAITRDGGTGQFFIDWRMYPNLYGALESCGWQVKNVVVWDKEHFGMGTNYRNQHEFVIYAEKGNAEFATHSMGNVIRSKRVASEFHPTEKPLGLLFDLITSATLASDIVLDPFMGSGSTLLAARMSGRKAIGIEIEEHYCEIAAERLSQEVLFTPEPEPVIKQENLL